MVCRERRKMSMSTYHVKNKYLRRSISVSFELSYNVREPFIRCNVNYSQTSDTLVRKQFDFSAFVR